MSEFLELKLVAYLILCTRISFLWTKALNILNKEGLKEGTVVFLCWNGEGMLSVTGNLEDLKPTFKRINYVKVKSSL